ncbi:putative glycolipid-binding domain-containing protein [Microbacterium lacus]|uniref:putative glycolipid-binding domain-containing protein n=1 Tax=Microbacterium lacus TaxID=415217 RepID=UPI000C2CD3FF|nr:putative glycolipid-binding domain-containing protein [Microbacterium lacus]
MRLTPLPSAESWNHQGLRVGFEVAFFRDVRLGHRLTGHTTANESGALWSVGYDLTVDPSWTTISVRASRLSAQGTGEMTMTRDAQGHWIVGGTQRPDLDGCVDVDFESSAVTNTLPIHRLDFIVGASVDVPAAFVRADDLRVERLEQRYTLVGTTPDRLLFHYESSTFDFACDIPFDRAGLVVEYPGIAVRTPTGRG